MAMTAALLLSACPAGEQEALRQQILHDSETSPH